MKAVFLDSLTLDDLDMKPLQQGVTEWINFSQTDASQVVSRLRSADIAITNKVLIDQAVLQQLPDLKAIFVVATGVNNVEVSAASALKIPVFNCQGYGTHSVAQHALMLMLVLHTRFLAYQQAVTQQRWQSATQFCLLDYPIQELRGRALGIVGYGDLGQAVAKLADAFGMKILVSQRPGAPHKAQASSLDRVPFDELVQQVDVLSLHCPLNEHTRHLIDKTVLSRMKSDSFLINTARGGLVDENALLQALKSKQIAGAATDVLSIEPPSQGNVLLDESLPNLIVTPHCAWGSLQARLQIIQQTAENIQQWQLKQGSRCVNADLPRHEWRM